MVDIYHISWWTLDFWTINSSFKHFTNNKNIFHPPWQSAVGPPNPFPPRIPRSPMLESKILETS